MVRRMLASSGFRGAFILDLRCPEAKRSYT